MRFLSTLSNLVLSASLGAAAASDAKKGPNVLFIMTDDQDLHMNSLDVMENVKSLIADKGTTYGSHYCTVALCCPSRVNLLTGKAAHNTNVTALSPPYGGYPRFTANGHNDNYLATWLRDAGINTYYVGKLMNSHSIDNYNKPFPKGWTSSNFLLQPGTYDYLNNTWGFDKKKPKSYPGHNALDMIWKNSLDMLDKAINADKQFFLAVAPAIPHLGLNATGHGTHWPVPPPKWANAFKDKKIPRTPDFNPPKNLSSDVSWLRNLEQLSVEAEDVADQYQQARLRALGGVDDMVHDLIDKLDKERILDNTYVVYTTDNGFHIGQHRMGPGKECGFETDINIPMVMRGPGIPAGHHTQVVTTHTDMVQTFMNMLNVKPSEEVSKGFDGIPMPLTQQAMDQRLAERPSEHVNVEYWGSIGETGHAVSPIFPAHIPGGGKNTYKALRLIGNGFNLYYSVWCTNEHQLFNDPYQTKNLFTKNHLSSGLLNKKYHIEKVKDRLDALLLVLKNCQGTSCIDPWTYGFKLPDTVKSLHDAMDPKWDSFFAKQPKVSFTACKHGQLLEFEGPQKPLQYNRKN